MNKQGKYLFTSESVGAGHPDKMCDQISDAILDAALSDDPDSRVAIETLTKTGFVIVAGELTTKTYIDVQKVVRDTIRDIGYDDPDYGFDCDGCGVLNAISEQSPNISQGVTSGKGLHKEQGAGDQGLMFGFATNETPELMPLPIIIAHKLTKKLSVVRKSRKLKYLRPDTKSQVTVEYYNGQPKRVDTVVIATQHSPKVKHSTIVKDVIKYVIKPICGKWIDKKTKIHVNATGAFVVGGPVADAGVTGRKIIVDTYGGHGSHGGGAFSGKDPSKVDRSASYAARYIAKNIVATKLADKCEVQLAYAIGVAQPVSVLVHTFGTNKIPEREISRIVVKHFPLKPADIIRHLKLKRPIYRKTAAYGHFGRNDSDFTWEKLDKVEVLRKECEDHFQKPEFEGINVPLDGM
ncbi:methionine adenosyltransferase [Candidatus Woesearchaeota archaeon]|jgi:S-adenosylmethionine synthetase|nr:methionine adenosyltransferase [Candidatus Woesearchaeota archaeon]|tara:strand:+ start:208 stop:1428 length:1221 start_codon:yes stop_codon:yes gene_type:complete